MGFFNATIAAYVAGRTVRMAHLFEFRFVPRPLYYWTGVGTLKAGDKTWIGGGNLISWDGMDETLAMESTQARFTISGAILPSHIITAALAEDRSLYVGKLARAWFAFFDDNWQIFDDIVAYRAYLVDGITVDREPAAEDGSIVRSLTVTAENIFYNRRIPPNGNYTDSDQQQRKPGDQGLEFIPQLLDKTIPIPW